MDKKYVISEKELLDLIECRARLEALEAGGVDNWSWYGDSFGDYLCDIKEEYGLNEDDDLDFSDIARKEIQNFKEVTDNAK